MIFGEIVMKNETKLGNEILLKEKDTKIKELEERIKYLEQCLQKKEARKMLIKDIRKYLDKISNIVDYDRQDLSSSIYYLKVKPFLSIELNNKINDNINNVTYIGYKRQIDYFKIKILDEIAELERQWELI